MDHQSTLTKTDFAVRADSWADTATSWDQQVEAVFRRTLRVEPARRERTAVGREGRSHPTRPRA